MPFSYRRRVRTSRRTWLNVSSRGVSASAKAGPVTVNSRGRVTVKLGRGFSWRSGR